MGYKKKNVWREDRVIPLTWSSPNFVMTAWKPRFREGTSNLRVVILKPQIDIINTSMVAFIVDANNNESMAQE